MPYIPWTVSKDVIDFSPTKNLVISKESNKRPIFCSGGGNTGGFDYTGCRGMVSFEPDTMFMLRSYFAEDEPVRRYKDGAERLIVVFGK